LFGGCGKAIHVVLGGIVIAAIDNGMGLQGFSAAARNSPKAEPIIEECWQSPSSSKPANEGFRDDRADPERRRRRRSSFGPAVDD
jgi:hypothetical protein